MHSIKTVPKKSIWLAFNLHSTCILCNNNRIKKVSKHGLNATFISFRLTSCKVTSCKVTSRKVTSWLMQLKKYFDMMPSWCYDALRDPHLLFVQNNWVSEGFGGFRRVNNQPLLPSTISNIDVIDKKVNHCISNHCIGILEDNLSWDSPLAVGFGSK